MSRYNLAQKLNEIYGRGIKQGLTFQKQGSHFVLYNGGNKVYSPSNNSKFRILLLLFLKILKKLFILFLFFV